MKLAAVIRELMAAGLQGEALAQAVERIEGVRSSGAERQARYRERKRNSDVTPSQASHVTPSEPSRVVSTSLPSEEVKNPQSPPSEEPAPKGARAHPMPADFALDDDLVGYGLSLSLTHAEVKRCEADMIEWAGNNRSRSVGKKHDWRAFAKTWLRRFAAERRPTPQQPRAGPRPTGKPDPWAKIVRATAGFENGQEPQHANGLNGRRAGDYDPRTGAHGRDDQQRGPTIDVEPLGNRSGTGTYGG